MALAFRLRNHDPGVVELHVYQCYDVSLIPTHLSSTVAASAADEQLGGGCSTAWGEG